MTYTTEQLINILDQELRASWKGQRIVLSSARRLNDSVLAKALGTEKLSKVFAYRDFRAQIHAYQQQYQVSGLVWRECNYQGIVVRFPEVHNHLIPIPGDKEILMKAKASVLAFWHQVTANLQFWLAGSEPSLISSESVYEIVRNAEWAEVDVTRQEFCLGLCWGNPQEYRYQWAKPTSGCERIIAACHQPSLIKF